jgi:mRNA-degrading endonuclease RelE of RelBE toxin-antitoxin system
MARVTVTPEAAEEIEVLPVVPHVRVMRVINRLEAWPNVSGAKPLRGRLAGCYRVRTGDYRVQFRVRNDVVIVEKVGHRDGFYED